MNLLQHRSLVAIAATGLLSGQGPVPPPSAATDDGNRYGFADWHPDYPVSLELPSPSPAQLYQRTPHQALEQVAAHLQGNVRREVWQMATEFFDRAPDDAVGVLVAAMDRALGQPMLQDVVRNTIEAMGRMARPEFDEPLRRALEHPNAGIRQAAFAALATSGSADSVRRTYPLFMGMDGRAKQAWLRSARARLGADAVPMFAKLMVPETPIAIRDLILKEALQMPPEQCAVVLEHMWEEAVGDFKAIAASVLHAAGKTSGTLWLHNALVGDDPALTVRALKQLEGRDFGMLREDVMRLSTHLRPDVRLAVAEAMVGVEGDDIDKTYEVLAGPEELVETKSVALRELTKRGRTDAVTYLLGEMASATGTRLQVQLRLLTASGDDRVVPLLRDRFMGAPDGEGREFLQSLALCLAPSATGVLLDLFAGPDRKVSPPNAHGQQLSTVTYIPVLLPNLRGHEGELADYWTRLDHGDYVRRSLYLNALSGIAIDRQDQEILQRVSAILRTVLFDSKELPQLRIQALNALTRQIIVIDDVRKLRRLQEPENTAENAAMRAFVKDFLFEYF